MAKKKTTPARKQTTPARKKTSKKPAAPARGAVARKSAPGAKLASKPGKTVDAYVASLPSSQAAVVKALRAIVKKAAPRAAEVVKWSQPVYESDGPFCYIKAHGKSVNIGFWRGAELTDGKRLLEGTGTKMRHVKLATPDAIDAGALTAFVRQAVKLNAKKGDPSR